CTGVAKGVCDDHGACVTPGTCGDGNVDPVSLDDGQYITEQCDLGPKNTDEEGQDSCCSTHCTLRDSVSICRFSDTVCIPNTQCRGRADGVCPDDDLSSQNGALCQEDCIFGGHCANGTCTGTRRKGARRICDAEVKVGALKSLVPPTKTRCRTLGGATAAPN